MINRFGNADKNKMWHNICDRWEERRGEEI